MAPVGGEDDNKLSDTNLALTKETLDKRLRTRVPVKAGPHAVGVTFLRKNSAASVEPLQPFTRDLDMQNMNGVPIIELVQITGPFDGHGAGRYAEPPPDLRVHACRRGERGRNRRRQGFGAASPKFRRDRGGRTRCAKRMLSTIARRAYRRPVTDAEVPSCSASTTPAASGHVRQRDRGVADGSSSRARSFCSAPSPIRQRWPPARSIRCRDLELASRLSFFLWSSDSRRRAADCRRAGQAQGSGGARPAGPADARRSAVESARRQLRRAVAVPAQPAELHPRQRQFPNFDDNLRQAFRQETSCSSRASCARTEASSTC